MRILILSKLKKYCNSKLLCLKPSRPGQQLRRHPELVSGSHKSNAKHAAMFGALSVISGAALYSAIQNAKVTHAVTTLSNMVKAYESYFLDTGSHLDLYCCTRDLKSLNLFEEPTGVTGWKGLYLTSATKSAGAPNNYISLSSSSFSSGMYLKIKQDNWGAQPHFNSGSTLDCTYNNCSPWPAILVKNKTLAESIDLMVDGSVDYDKGNIRIVLVNSTYYVMMKTNIQIPV